jgi:hypothetical protein
MRKKTYALLKIQHIVQSESLCFMSSKELSGVSGKIYSLFDTGRRSAGGEGSETVWRRQFFVVWVIQNRYASLAGRLF